MCSNFTEEERERVGKGSYMSTLIKLSLCGGYVSRRALGWLLMPTVSWSPIGQ